MPVTLSPRLGADYVRTTSATAIAAPTNWSAYCWLRRPGADTAGNFWSLGEGAADIDAYIAGATADLLVIDRRTTGTSGSWHVTAANDRIDYSASDWVWFGISQSGTAKPTVYSAAPKQSVDFGACTVTVDTSPTGSPTTGSERFYIGNYYAANYALGGDMAWVGFHDVVLTEGEMREAFLRGFTLRGRKLLCALDSTSALYDVSGSALAMEHSGAADLTGSGPPVLPIWVPGPMSFNSYSAPAPGAALASAATISLTAAGDITFLPQQAAVAQTISLAAVGDVDTAATDAISGAATITLSAGGFLSQSMIATAEGAIGSLELVLAEKDAALAAAVAGGDRDAIDLASSEASYARRALREANRALDLIAELEG